MKSKFKNSNCEYWVGSKNRANGHQNKRAYKYSYTGQLPEKDSEVVIEYYDRNSKDVKTAIGNYIFNDTYYMFVVNENVIEEEDILSWEYSTESKKEEPKRMTYRQLAEWLAKGNGQCDFGGIIATDNTYDKIHDDEEVDRDYKIRRWGSDIWIEPTISIYKEDCK